MKHVKPTPNNNNNNVALRVRAWIETYFGDLKTIGSDVALRVRAWIETAFRKIHFLSLRSPSA